MNEGCEKGDKVPKILFELSLYTSVKATLSLERVGLLVKRKSGRFWARQVSNLRPIGYEKLGSSLLYPSQFPCLVLPLIKNTY